jgi:hypothetical protein
MKCSEHHGLKRLASAMAVAGLLAMAAGQAQAAAEIIINNTHDPGVGFNDPTPATPIAGNTGTTVGEQRLIAFTYAANIWGAALTSSQPIIINARFIPQITDNSHFHDLYLLFLNCYNYIVTVLK